MANKKLRSSQDWVQSAVERFEGSLIRYAARLTGDPEGAHDVVQETFLRLCAEDQLKIEQHLAAWLFTVCRNLALDVRRKEGRMNPLSETHMEMRSSGDPSPAAEVERREVLAQILQVLDTIPDNQQEVIRLKFQNGFSYREISGVTGLSVSNVGFLIHTGLKTIRQRLKTESGLAPKA